MSLLKSIFLPLVLLITLEEIYGVSLPISEDKGGGPSGSSKVLVRKTKLRVSPREVTLRGHSTPNKSGTGCNVDGIRFFEGQYMYGVGGPCKACYCLKGKQHCTEVRCKAPPVPGCTPVIREGRCCPIKYDCDEASQNALSRSNGDSSVSRNVPPELNLGYSFDYDFGLMENHVRIERQSDSQAFEEELSLTTESEPSLTAETTVPNIIEEESSKNTKMSEKTNNEPENGEEILKETKPSNEKNNSLPESNVIEEASKANEDTAGQNIKTDITNEDNKTTEPVLNKEDIPKSENLEENLFSSNINDTYDDYYDYLEEDYPTEAPELSVSDLLTKLRNQNKGDKTTLVDILPGPITATRNEELGDPDKLLTEADYKDEPEFMSYDINVGASLMTGDEEPIGVGQVIPIDLHRPEIRQTPPSSPLPIRPVITSTTTAVTTPLVTSTEENKTQPSFLNTFLSLLTGGGPKPEKPQKEETLQTAKPEVKEDSPFMLPPPPPSLSIPPPPPLESRPPPFLEQTPPAENIPDEGVPESNNELDYELDLEAKPTIENEVRTPPKPNGGSVTRNELPIRRRPSFGGGRRPLRPGLFASRPNFQLTRPSKDVPNEEKLPDLPSDPIIEGGFAAIKEATSSSPANESEPILEPETKDEPTLPPSLPNLQIIPFVAADAVVNQGSPPDDGGSGFTPRPFGASSSSDCREGGKLWKNGETVARGDNDPCVLCRCNFGKVICQRQECPTLPDGCIVEQEAAEGECCPKISCDESANISIVDTLPSFRPIEEEEEIVDIDSKPIRPSLFSLQNRRPPFAPASRRPAASKPGDSLRKPIIPSRGKPEPRTTTEEASPDEVTEPSAPTERPTPRRPIRPFSRPSLKPSRNDPPRPFGNRPRPFAFLNRTGGTRPPFIPPRFRTTTERRPISVATTTEKPSTTAFTPTTTTTTTTITASTTEPQEVLPETQTSKVMPPIRLEATLPIREPVPEFVAPAEEMLPPGDPKPSFDDLFADLLSKERPSLPRPIHTPAVVEKVSGSEKPFILPPDILLPKPLPPSNQGIEGDDIINFVQQDKFRLPENNVAPEVVFNRQPPKVSLGTPKPPKPLPEIPEEVKAQLPLGNDPILVSGLLELGGCNVYGRMFEVGERIKEISGQCKACQCTKVGVQCLPIC